LALLSLADRLSTWDRRSPITRFSSSERVSVPDRRSFVVRLSAPARFLMSPIVCLRWLPRIVAATRYRGGRARDKLPRAGILIARKANQAPASGCLCIHDSRRLMGVPKVRGVREGRPDLASYLAANSSRRRFMNGSAFSAKLRQRSACSFKNELSTFDSNATA
jgi:hypothetical protein